MPPPPSPTKSIKSSGYGRPASRQSDAFSSRPASRASESRPPTPLEASFSALDASGSALQDRISSLMASTSSSSPATNRLSLLNGPSLLTEEDLKVTSPHQQGRIDQLLQRIDALEKENLSLVLDQGKTPEVKTSIPLPDEGDAVRGVAPDPAVAAAESRAVNAERQVQAHATRLTILESELSAASSTSRNLQASIQALERAAAAAGEDRARAEAEAKQVARDAAAKLEEADALVASLKQAVEAQTKGDSDHSAEVQAKAKEIEILQGKVARLGGDLDRERGELREEIEGLKRAGQVCLPTSPGRLLSQLH
jgi:DNA repair exonuclease SbcCD ATPase subunit